MATSPFIVTEHTIDCQYIREYPWATTSQDAPLKLLVKKYTPTNNTCPQPGDVTLIGAHGSGFPKELYEPLWEEIIARSQQDGFRIRAIWIADISNQGASGIYNSKYLGNDPSWLDHSRDLLQMINHFRADMPQPIMGVGHSMGGAQQIFISSFHPRLYHSLILVEPYIVERQDDNGGYIFGSRIKQNDSWATWSDAIQASRRQLRSWDKRVIDRWFTHGYRILPATESDGHKTPGSPDAANTIALTTPIPQEMFMYYRPNFRGHKQLGLTDTENGNGDKRDPPHDSLFAPDIIADGRPPFYRPEPRIAYHLLPHLRPSVLYVSGEQSVLSRYGHISKAMESTGISVGGSGGSPCGKVKHVSIEQAGHTVPFEKIAETAAAIGPWIAQEVQRWRHDELRVAEGWNGLSAGQRSSYPKDFIKKMEVGIADRHKKLGKPKL